MKKKTAKNNIWLLVKKLLFWSLAIGFSLIIIGLLIILIDIKVTTNSICKNAQQKYSDTCPQSLIKLLENKDESFYDKNDAIWTLGRMRSQEAYATLQNMYTGIIPDREPYDGVISQYEIRKALLRIDETTDISPRREMTIKEKLSDCMPKSDMGSKKICDDIINSITTYKGCAEAGFPIQESYPERCRLPDGRLFTNTK